MKPGSGIGAIGTSIAAAVPIANSRTGMPPSVRAGAAASTRSASSASSPPMTGSTTKENRVGSAMSNTGSLDSSRNGSGIPVCLVWITSSLPNDNTVKTRPVMASRRTASERHSHTTPATRTIIRGQPK